MARSPNRTRKSGVVLLATLVFIFMLTVIIGLFLREIENRIRYRAQTVGDRDLRRIAYNYLEYSEAVLVEFRTFDTGTYSPSQGWGTPLTYADFPLDYRDLKVTVAIEDATDKIPLSLVDEDVFMSIMEAMGVNPFDAARFRDGYFDWIDKDDDPRVQGAESREYDIDSRFFLSPPNAPIKDLNELQYISGFHDWLDPSSRFYNPELFDILKRCVTTYHDYPVNLNAARPEVMEILRIHDDMDVEALRSYQAGNDRILGTEDDLLITETLPANVKNDLGENRNRLYGFETHLCRIRIDIRRHEMAGFHLEALIDLGGSATQETPSAETPNPENTPESPDQNLPNAQKSPVSNSKGFDVLVIRENFVEAD